MAVVMLVKYLQLSTTSCVRFSISECEPPIVTHFWCPWSCFQVVPISGGWLCAECVLAITTLHVYAKRTHMFVIVPLQTPICRKSVSCSTRVVNALRCTAWCQAFVESCAKQKRTSMMKWLKPSRSAVINFKHASRPCFSPGLSQNPLFLTCMLDLWSTHRFW